MALPREYTDPQRCPTNKQGNNHQPLDDSSSRVTVAGIAAAPDVALRVAQRIAAIGDTLEKSVAAWTENSPRATPVVIAPSSALSGPQSSSTVSAGCIRLLFAAWRLGYLYSAATIVASGFASWISRNGHCVKLGYQLLHLLV
ncbi:hypothetical protein EMCRGX_G024184 [Ephydatia muelleri]